MLQYRNSSSSRNSSSTFIVYSTVLALQLNVMYETVISYTATIQQAILLNNVSHIKSNQKSNIVLFDKTTVRLQLYSVRGNARWALKQHCQYW